MCLDYIDQGNLVGWDCEFAYFQIISRKISIYPTSCEKYWEFPFSHAL